MLPGNGWQSSGTETDIKVIQEHCYLKKKERFQENGPCPTGKAKSMSVGVGMGCDTKE